MNKEEVDLFTGRGDFLVAQRIILVTFFALAIRHLTKWQIFRREIQKEKKLLI